MAVLAYELLAIVDQEINHVFFDNCFSLIPDESPF